MSAVAVAVAGLVALAVAMGIGRFAFTPILPMMLHDGVVDLHAASWLASANYIGYLVGAVLCTLQPLIWRGCRACRAIDAPSLVRAGLVATDAAHARHGVAVRRGLAVAALRRRHRQRAGLRVLVGVVPGAARGARPRRRSAA